MAGHASQKKQDRSSWSFEFNKNTDLPANLMCSAGLCPQQFVPAVLFCGQNSETFRLAQRPGFHLSKVLLDADGLSRSLYRGP